MANEYTTGWRVLRGEKSDMMGTKIRHGYAVVRANATLEPSLWKCFADLTLQFLLATSHKNLVHAMRDGKWSFKKRKESGIVVK